MAEKNLSNDVQVQLSKVPGCRVFRNNTGTGWQGRQEWQGRKLVLHDPRPINAGLTVGSSDLIGWTSIEITPDMVGRKVAVFTAIELKTSGTGTSDAQATFIRNVRNAGGFAGVAKNVPDAVQIVTQKTIE